jgi:hypothetical protein
MRRARVVAGCLAVAGLVAAGCGDDEDDALPDEEPTAEADDGDAGDSADEGDAGDSGGSGDGATREDYVEALSVVGADDTFTQEDAECVSGALVDVVGLDVLNEHDVLAQVSQTGGANWSLADFGVEVDQDTKAELADEVGGCLDVKAAMVGQLAADPSIGPDVAACIGEQVDADLWPQLLVLGLTSGDTPAPEDQALADRMLEVGTTCAGAASAGG